MNAALKLIIEILIDIFFGLSITCLVMYTIYEFTGNSKWSFVGFIALSVGLYPLLMLMGIGKKTANKIFPDEGSKKNM